MTARTPRRGRVTLNDVARRAGVSTSTAARALGGYGMVREATARRVRQAADDLAYRPDVLARSMITGRTMTLGVVVADVENEFFARLIRGFTDVAAREGFDVLLLNTDEDPGAEQAAVSLLLERRVDGIAVAPASAQECAHLAAVVDGGTPLLLLDRRVHGVAADMVGIDSVRAAQDAVGRLVAVGHRRIGMVTGAVPAGPKAVSTSTDRITGYRRALTSAGIRFRPELVRTGGFRRAEARRHAAALLRLPDAPTALFATDATICLGILEAVRDAGLTIPGDVSVIGFDDTAWAEVMVPGLSVVDQPANPLGALAAERLIGRVRGESGRPGRHLLASRFVERASVAPPPPARRIIAGDPQRPTSAELTRTAGEP